MYRRKTEASAPKGRYNSLKLSNYCNFNTSCTRMHPLSLVLLQSSINSYRHSFLVNTVFYGTLYRVMYLISSFAKLCINCFVVINLYVYVFFLVFCSCVFLCIVPSFFSFVSSRETPLYRLCLLVSPCLF